MRYARVVLQLSVKTLYFLDDNPGHTAVSFRRLRAICRPGSGDCFSTLPGSARFMSVSLLVPPRCAAA